MAASLPVLEPSSAGSGSKRMSIFRLIRAAQPISRTDIAARLGIDRSTVTENVKPLVTAGIVTERMLDERIGGRRPRVLSFADNGDYLIGINLGVRHSQIGVASLGGDHADEEEYETPRDPLEALIITKRRINSFIAARPGQNLRAIGVSVPGMTDPNGKVLLYAPNLDWTGIDIAAGLAVEGVPVIVENDAAAAAAFEAREKTRSSADETTSSFILVRSGTGIGVGLVIGNEVYRGSGETLGIAGEFGHMTIVAGGKPCVCGNRGCWERYASAASAASLYLGERPVRRGETMPRFVEIVRKAENGDVRARRSLEMIGDYLGIGIANVIMGTGIPRVIVSGRLVYGWQFIKPPLDQAIMRSIVGKAEGWSVEAGSPAGAAIGGAVEVAAESYLSSI